MKRPIKVVLVDDHVLVRETLARQLEQEPDMQVVATAGDADTAVTHVVEQQPDIVILDIDMPGREAFDAAAVIRQRCPATRLIILSGYFHDRYIDRALAVGASSYLSKAEPLATVVKAIRAVATGGTYFSPEVEARIVFDADGIRLQTGPQSRASSLTEQQIRVLCHLARGLSKRDIAELMHISESTVSRHCDNLMARLGIHNRVELARYAIREGLVEA